MSSCWPSCSATSAVRGYAARQVISTFEALVASRRRGAGDLPRLNRILQVNLRLSQVCRSGLGSFERRQESIGIQTGLFHREKCVTALLQVSSCSLKDFFSGSIDCVQSSFLGLPACLSRCPKVCDICALALPQLT